MIRFQPDNWIDVFMRPFDMVSPEQNVYVEIGAPDIRIAAVYLFALGVLLTWRRNVGDRTPSAALLLLMTLAAAPWLATTGNGRYFIPFLLISGPLAIGLLRLLPVSGGLKLAACGLLVAVQAFLLIQVSPWRSWGWVEWGRGPFFELAQVPQVKKVTYVTLSSLSYSAVAPFFPVTAGWTNMRTGGGTPRDAAMIDRYLSSGEPLMIVAPSLPAHTLPDGAPAPAVYESIAALIRAKGLSFVEPASCNMVSSATLNVSALGDGRPLETRPPIGFWICPVRYDGLTAMAQARSELKDVDAVFNAAEKLCPRFFRAGESETTRTPDGYVREYAGSDTKLYVLDSGAVTYKYWRSLNQVYIGDRADVAAGRGVVQCEKIRTPNWRTGGL